MFGLYTYMKRKIPYIYRESKDDSSVTLPVLHSPFHLSYPGSEETNKYETYEIKVLLQNYYAVTFFAFIYLAQSFKIIELRSIYIHVRLRQTTFYYGKINKDKWVTFVNNQLDAQFSFMYIYFYSLHVSGNHVPIIRRINFINTAGICHSV
jgi:hypothetical protein